MKLTGSQPDEAAAGVDGAANSNPPAASSEEAAAASDAAVAAGDDIAKTATEAPTASHNARANPPGARKSGASDNTCTIHEHLHSELRQLLSVTPPTNTNGKGSGPPPTSPPRQQPPSSARAPRHPLQRGKHEHRRKNKVRAANRLLEALRSDRTGRSAGEDASGPIHGCAGSRWELLPPAHGPASAADSAVGGGSTQGEDDNGASPLLKEGPAEPTVPGGGLRLPGLDWNKTFRKGYAVLVWVRPTLDVPDDSRQGGSPEGLTPRKQVLYRFATSPHYHAPSAAGVCAIVGQWRAVPLENTEGKRGRTMLTATVTAYALPNADPAGLLSAPSAEGTEDASEATEGGTDETGAETGASEEEEGGKKARKKTKGRRKEAGAPDIGFKGGSGAHARNMEHFRTAGQRSSPGATATSAPRLVSKAKKLSAAKAGRGDKDGRRKKPGDLSHSSSHMSGGYLTSRLALPADEWSLLSIQHTHPYLRRPELIVSVNGEEMAKGDLAYPALDAVVFPNSEEDLPSGGAGASTSMSPTNARGDDNGGGERGGGAQVMDEHERRALRRRGILADCTLLDGTFANGVLLLPNNSATTCTLSVHSLALLSGPPVPPAVLAVLSERGPLSDASGGKLSFVLGPVPPCPQNREAVVALSAGHGYYGTRPDAKGGNGGIVAGGAGGRGMHELAPPRSLGVPVSVGITPGVYPGNVPALSVMGSSSHSDGNDETWIGRGEEHAAHVGLQGLLGRAVWTFHSADTTTLAREAWPAAPAAAATRRRIVCAPSGAPSKIGGADAVPKVGIVRPLPPGPPLPAGGLELTGNARYRNVAWEYVAEENRRTDVVRKIAPFEGGAYNPYDRLPVSFPRALQAANAIGTCLLPLRLALPKTGPREVNDVQRALRSESYAHLNDLLANDAELMGRLIALVAECIRCGGSAMRDEALQSGAVHAVATLVRKVLLRGARLGLLPAEGGSKEMISPPSPPSLAVTGRKIGETVEYDGDHDASCPPVVPSAVSEAMVGLIDACCGPAFDHVGAADPSSGAVVANPFRGLLRVRRASDLALTALFGLAMDFDLLGNDASAAAALLGAMAARYCRAEAVTLDGGDQERGPFNGEDYGLLLRKQINLQYFLDCLRIRFDHSVSSSPRGMPPSSHASMAALDAVASALSDILYAMLLSTLTSAAGTNVTRGERDVGALVATLTECPLGSVTAHVVTTSIARLLVRCGVMSPLCLGPSAAAAAPHRPKGGRRRDPGDVALESRLGRNLLLCHYHDIVAPLLLSRSAPRSFSAQREAAGDRDEKDANEELAESIDFASSVGAGDSSQPLDWTHHWRLSLLTFAWLSSLAGMEESKAISTSTGHLLLLAGKAGSLDGAILGCKQDNKAAEDNMLAVLSHFLVLSSSREKDNSAAGKRAESISRRVSSFMPLVPGIAISLLSPSIQRNYFNGDQPKMVVTSETSLAVDTLKQLLSMLSLAIQALYGSKKGGLLSSSKTGAKGTVQLSRAKKIFVSGAKEYVPLLLEVVSMLDEPIQLSRRLVGSKGRSDAISVDQLKSPPPQMQQRDEQLAQNDSAASGISDSSNQIQRKRTDSSDKDWVDVQSSPQLGPSANGDVPPVEDLPPSTPATPSSTTAKPSSKGLESKHALEQSVFDDLCSCQDMALYAVSRLVAQAMKYGGGEASTAIWRSIVASLSGNGLFPLAQANEVKAIAPPEANGDDAPKETEAPKPGTALSKSTLCHLAALVLSKFARHHDHRLETYRSPWNLETCSAVARLMDLVEEKKLLSQPDRVSRRGSNISFNADGSPRKYGIDQVRLLKALLEIMASGRESGGWSQIKPLSSHAKDGGESKSGDDAKKDDTANNGSLDKALPHSNYDLYHQTSSAKKANGPSNSKLLLPILQSCLRIIIESVGVIRSEAVVITAAAAGKSPSTAKLLELVTAELHKSLAAAIEGLTFPVSRDIFMNATASLRQSITHHQLLKDSKAEQLCSDLLLDIVKAMRFRYVDECSKKKASFDAYEDDEAIPEKEGPGTKAEPSDTETNEGNKEDLHSQVIEKLILGEDTLPKNDADFVAFPGDAKHDSDPAKLLVSPMGWAHYKGLGAALNRCYREEPSATTSEEKAMLVLSILEPYADSWDRIQRIDDAEAELVDLFDESIHLGSTSKALIEDFNAHSKASESKKKAGSALLPSLTASDAMARFIEAQSMLRHQHHFLAFEYLQRRRFGRSAFVERLCWRTWMDCIDAGVCNGLWERAVNDGGRDFSGRIATLPIFPQFPRFIPSYLDHSPSSNELDIKLISQNVKIVDITKKEVTEDMLEQFDSLNETADGPLPEGAYVEDVDLPFVDRSDSEPNFPTAEEKAALSESDENVASEGRPRTAASESDGVAEDEILPSESQEESQFNQLAISQGSFHFATSSFSFPPDSSSLHSMGEGRRLGGGSMQEYYGSCLQVRPECSLKCTVMLTESHLIVEYDNGEGALEGEHEFKRSEELSPNDAKNQEDEKHMREALRPKAMRWNISEASHIYLRRYRLRDSALEIFFIPSAGATTGGSAFFAGSRSLFIDFGTGTWGNTRRDDAANAIMKRAPMQTIKQWPDRSGQFLHEELKKLMQAWTHGAISNFDYLLSLNVLAGRSYNDICQYPVFPWVLSNYTSEEVPDLTDKANFRDLSKPMGALNEERLAELLERFQTFDDPTIPPFMYGSHYSTSAGVVIHFLLRLHPFSSLHRHLQSGHFDVADRLFSSVERTWAMCTGRSAAEVKELIPEFYSNPSFLRNSNEFKLGTSQDGEVLGDVILPPWANGSPEKFVEVMRLALESDICSEMLPDWIDLIFGRKQQGKSAIEAQNVFFYLTYYGSVDVASIEDEALRHATELQIAHFGQCPMQLFYRRHAKKQTREHHRRRKTLSDLYDIKSAPLSSCRSLDQGAPETDDKARSVRKALPFMDAPLSYWVHLGAPPPGPHAPLISTRLALADRCLAVDSKGVFHFFRWAWKPEFEDEATESDSGSSQGHDDAPDKDDQEQIFCDKGCFVAQRELFSFRTVPRLPYSSPALNDTRHATVGISKTLFANRSLLLVVSDGDGKGALAMQLVDPVKGEIRGEVIVPSIHADCITAIDMDPIGTASGQGGVGGELVVVGSADGSATLWRFISSHYWPLRPRLRMMGHFGAPVQGVAISSSLGICASVSSRLCCLFDVGNGAMIRNFAPPHEAGRRHLEDEIKGVDATDITVQTTFADTSAMCLSILGFVVAVCSTKLIQGEDVLNEVLSLELFTVEGRHVGSRPLEQHRGMPKKMFSTVDGRAIFVCAGGGVSVHLVSSIQPLVTVDQWVISSGDDVSANQVVYDLDFGPTIARPVVAAAGGSQGTLRLHALRGISKWCIEHQRSTVSSAVGNVLALPAQTVKNALGGVSSFGSSFLGSAKEISKEAFSVVKESERGFFFRKKKG